MNREMYHYLQVKQRTNGFAIDKNESIKYQAKLLDFEELVIKVMKVNQENNIKLVEMEREIKNLKHQIAICNQQIESKRYQYLRQFG